MKEKKLFLSTLFIFLFLFSGCYSVFSGVTSGRIVDAESTESPKAGIADADIYAYTSRDSRDSDFSQWDGTSRFKPKAEYFCHTNSGADGSFSLSRLIWKNSKSKFGKDADYTRIYLLFYHENYGLVKSTEDILIVSDSTSDSVFQELTRIRKTTNLIISLNDVVSNQLSEVPVTVKISVPQATASNPDRLPVIYERTLTGNGNLEISYPRWQNDNDKSNRKENEPQIFISYKMAEDEITWKSCFNKNNETKDYSFFDSEKNQVAKIISGDNFKINLYGKPTKISIPAISGNYGDSDKSENDGIILSMKAKISMDDESEFSEDCGEVSTYSREVGTAGNREHGIFSNLGNGSYIINENYTGKYCDIMLQISTGETVLKTFKVRSDTSSYNVKL